MMLRHRFASMNPAFLPALTLPAPERIHAEGGLGHWAEAAHIPSDRRAPEVPNLPAGEPNQRTRPKQRQVPHGPSGRLSSPPAQHRRFASLPSLSMYREV